MDFEEQYMKDIDRWHNKIDNALPDYSITNPYLRAGAYNKAITIYEEFESWCGEHIDGDTYFTLNEYDELERLRDDYDEYADNDFYVEKEQFDKSAEYNKTFISFSKQIKKILENNDLNLLGITMRFKPEHLHYILDAIVRLEQSNEIILKTVNETTLYAIQK